MQERHLFSLGKLAHRPKRREENGKQGDEVIIVTSVSNEEAKQKYPGGWKSPKPYLRIVPQPK